MSATRTTTDDLPGTTVAGAAVRLDRVRRTFADGTRALAPVTLTVEPGEMVALVGPSGCGKSTLLRLVAGLDEASGGTIRVDRDSLGYVFQDPTLLPWRTVAANVELPAQLVGLSRQERRERSAAAISLTGLTGFERHLPRTLSGGMRMRVSLARALTLHPRVFLFDEPFGALDEITRERLNDELLRIFAVERFAGLFVTHSVLEATFVSTRVLVMSSRPGRVVADIPVPFGPDRTPALRFDAAFIRIASQVSDALREVS